MLAFLADGESWSSSALALALGTSQRTVQRALDALAAAGKVQSFGRGRARRWIDPARAGIHDNLVTPWLRCRATRHEPHENDQPPRSLREYGPFPGVDGRAWRVPSTVEHVWFAAGDTLTALDPASGKTLRSIDVAAHAGTAFDGRHLFQIAEDRIQKIDPETGRVLATIPAPGGGGDSGLAWAEGTLWVGQYRDRKIHQIDPETGAILRTIESDRFVTGVTWVDGELWHGTWEGDESDLRRVDPGTGEVAGDARDAAGDGRLGARVGWRRSVLLRRRPQRDREGCSPARASGRGPLAGPAGPRRAGVRRHDRFRSPAGNFAFDRLSEFPRSSSPSARHWENTMNEVAVWGFRWAPPFAQGLVRDLRVRWALHEAGLPYETRLIGLEERILAAHRRRHPFGMVPVVEADGRRLIESGAIVYAIAKQSAALMPEDEAGRDQTLAWMFAALNTIDLPVQALFDIDVLHSGETWARLRRPDAVRPSRFGWPSSPTRSANATISLGASRRRTS